MASFAAVTPASAAVYVNLVSPAVFAMSGTNVFLDASRSYSDQGLPLSFFWDLTDSGTFTEQGAIVPFLVPVAPAGTGFTYVVRATDSLTTSSASGTVYVVPGAPVGVPEPATWALMINGFGMAGAALRRRRATVAG